MSQQQTLNINLTGLWTDPNQFSKVPPGSFVTADNVVIDSDGQVESRRGFNNYGSLGFIGYVKTMFTYQNTIIAHGSDNKLYYDVNKNGTSWPTYSGTYTPPQTINSSRIHATQARKNFYFTTGAGVYKLDAITSTPRLAGAPVALGGTAATTGATGFLPTTESVAYRVVWGYTDANGYQVIGAPSDRILVTNAAGADRDIAVTFYIPKNYSVGPTWFYQVYRSANSPAGVEPSDELQFTLEGTPTAGEIIAGVITSIDSTPSQFLGASLYTSVDGIATANTPPPSCTDIVTFNGFTFYANTSEPHTLTLTLDSTGAPNGIQVGDTITFTDGTNTFVLVGALAENAATGRFQVFTAGTPATNIANTAQSIVKIANTYSSNTFLAGYYISGFTDLPGQMRFTRLDSLKVSFRVNSTRNSCWTKDIPAAGSNFYNTSQNDSAVNRVMYSKQDLPEAVPLLNYINIGNSDSPIVRLYLLKNYLYVLKTDGVYRISGTSAPFSVLGIDTTTRITAPNCVQSLDNKLYFYSSMGIVAFDESATDVMEPIKTLVLQTATNRAPSFQDNSFGLSYESDKKYILSTPSLGSISTNPTQQYVWNYDRQGWVRWTLAVTAGLVNDLDNKVYFASQDSNLSATVMIERKDYASTDYADKDIPIDIVSIVGDTLTLTSTIGLTERMTIQQGLIQSIVETVDMDNNKIVVADVFGWIAGAAIAVTPIRVLLRTVPLAQSNPGILKEQCELSLIFRTAGFDELTMTISTDLVGNGQPFVVTPVRFGQWGTFPWGLQPWGGSTSGSNRIRIQLPTNTRRANWFDWTLEGERCFTSFALEGFSIMWHSMSSKQKG